MAAAAQARPETKPDSAAMAAVTQADLETEPEHHDDDKTTIVKVSKPDREVDLRHTENMQGVPMVCSQKKVPSRRVSM